MISRLIVTTGLIMLIYSLHL